MTELDVKSYELGMVATNCYIAYNHNTKEAIIVDPAAAEDIIIEEIEREGLTPIAILLTHGHFDHIMAASPLKEKYRISIYAHEEEKELLKEEKLNLSVQFGQKASLEADVYVTDGQILHLAGVDIRVIYTPGHTIGGVCYYIESEEAVFSGDTLFRESIGRSDFPTSNTASLLRSIKDKLFQLPPDVKVFPGHRAASTIAHEIKYNPFIRG